MRKISTELLNRCVSLIKEEDKRIKTIPEFQSRFIFTIRTKRIRMKREKCHAKKIVVTHKYSPEALEAIVKMWCEIEGFVLIEKALAP